MTVSNNPTINGLAAEFQRGTNVRHGLSEFYRDDVRIYSHKGNRNIPRSGTIALGAFRGSSRETLVTISDYWYDFNLANAYRDNHEPFAGEPINIRLVINGGAQIRENGAGFALTIGQFPANSLITVDNYGGIYGRGGVSSGAGGTNCINAAFWNQRMVFNNYGNVWAGGGAGGHGGQGGGGFYENVYDEFRGPACFDPWTDYDLNGNPQSCWQQDVGHGTYCNPYFWWDPCGYYACNCHVRRRDPVYTSGGGGGQGGYGQGWNVGATGGFGGSPGGANAGHGGNGGNGGGWGQNGSPGNQGYNGNNGGGAGGGAPGAAGVAFWGNGYNYVFNNYGGFAGRVD